MNEVTRAQFDLAVSIVRFAREGHDHDLFPSEMVDADRVDLNRLLDLRGVSREERERRYRQVAYAGVGGTPSEHAHTVLGYLSDYGFLAKEDAGSIAVRVSVACLRRLLKRYTLPHESILYGALLEYSGPGIHMSDRSEARMLDMAVERLDVALAKRLSGCDTWEDFVRFAASLPDPAPLLRCLLVRCGCEIPPEVWETLPLSVQNELSPYVPVLDSLSKRPRLDA